MKIFKQIWDKIKPKIRIVELSNGKFGIESRIFGIWLLWIGHLDEIISFNTFEEARKFARPKEIARKNIIEEI